MTPLDRHRPRVLPGGLRRAPFAALIAAGSRVPSAGVRAALGRAPAVAARAARGRAPFAPAFIAAAATLVVAASALAQYSEPTRPLDLVPLLLVENPPGVRSAAMAGAGVASVVDAGMAFWNPAALPARPAVTAHVEGGIAGGSTTLSDYLTPIPTGQSSLDVLRTETTAAAPGRGFLGLAGVVHTRSRVVGWGLGIREAGDLAFTRERTTALTPPMGGQTTTVTRKTKSGGAIIAVEPAIGIAFSPRLTAGLAVGIGRGGQAIEYNQATEAVLGAQDAVTDVRSYRVHASYKTTLFRAGLQAQLTRVLRLGLVVEPPRTITATGATRPASTRDSVETVPDSDFVVHVPLGVTAGIERRLGEGTSAVFDAHVNLGKSMRVQAGADEKKPYPPARTGFGAALGIEHEIEPPVRRATYRIPLRAGVRVEWLPETSLDTTNTALDAAQRPSYQGGQVRRVALTLGGGIRNPTQWADIAVAFARDQRTEPVSGTWYAPGSRATLTRRTSTIEVRLAFGAQLTGS